MCNVIFLMFQTIIQSLLLRTTLLVQAGAPLWRPHVVVIALGLLIPQGKVDMTWTVWRTPAYSLALAFLTPALLTPLLFPSEVDGKAIRQ